MCDRCVHEKKEEEVGMQFLITCSLLEQSLIDTTDSAELLKNSFMSKGLQENIGSVAMFLYLA